MAVDVRCETLARAVEATRELFIRYVRDFADDEATRQGGAVLPNHAVWSLGHCALTMHRAAQRYFGDSAPLPGSHFLTGDGQAGNPEQYDTESVCFGSTPRDDPSIYPGLERAMEIYLAACDRLAGAVRRFSGDLDEAQQWHTGSLTREAIIFRICFHNGTHTGQVVDLRRALRKARIIT